MPTTGRVLPPSTTPTPAPVPKTSSPAARPLFQKMPPFVCQLTSPSHYDTQSQEHVLVETQHILGPTLCDYVLLDLPQEPDGSYNPASYSFLTRSPRGNRFLFTVNVDSADIVDNVVALKSASFNESTRIIQQLLQPNRLLGYGTLRGWPVPRSATELNATENVLSYVYEQLAKVLNSSGVEENRITNFFAFKAGFTASQRRHHADFMSMLNRLNNLSLVIMLTITDEHQPEVAASSSWNRTCQPVPNTPKMQCEQQLFGRDPTGSTALDIGNGSCVFAWGPSQLFDVITFETPKTVRSKMVATYRRLGYSKTNTHVIGWTVYNLTLGLAPDKCNGIANRFNQIRKIMDENK